MRRSLLTVVLAAGFGAADQFLGARAFVVGAWATDASLLSAPWLLVAFLAGSSQRTARRAMTLGFVCTIAALVGYWTMTLSPAEGAVVSLRGIRGLLLGQATYALGAILTGPLFGWLGYRWRRRRDWISALVASLAVLCEPFAHAAAGATAGFTGVWVAETAVGLAMASFCLVLARRSANG